jgi:hypothetical protein
MRKVIFTLTLALTALFSTAQTIAGSSITTTAASYYVGASTPASTTVSFSNTGSNFGSGNTMTAYLMLNGVQVGTAIGTRTNCTNCSSVTGVLIPVGTPAGSYTVNLTSSSPAATYAGTNTLTIITPTWTGTTSATWTTAGNWQSSANANSTTVGGVCSAIVSSATNNPSITTAGQQLKNLTINASGNLTIATGASLTVNGDLTIASGGTITVTGTGSLTVTGNVVNNGTITGTGTSFTFGGNVSGSGSFPAAGVTLNGVSKTIAGTFTTLKLNAAGAFSLSGATTVTTLNLAIAGATLDLNGNNLTVTTFQQNGTAMSSVSSTDAFITSNGMANDHSGGNLIVRAVNGSKIIPIGISGSYSPVTISNTSGYDWWIQVQNGFSGFPATNSSSAYQNVWNISPFTTGTSTKETNPTAADLTFAYPDAAWNTGNASAVKIYHYNATGTGWAFGWNPATSTEFSPALSNSLRSLTLTGWNQFSPFAVARVGQTLPVSFLSFNGKRLGNRNLLNWATATEKNNRGFEIQRSNDGVSYAAIGFVKSTASNGSSTSDLIYSFEDLTTADRSYYRLRQVDVDNKSSFSKIVKLSLHSGDENSISGLYPNPANNQITAQVEATSKGAVLLTIVDGLGRPVMTRSATVVNGANTINIPVSSLSRGRYTLQVTYSDQTVSTTSFIKQ